MLIIQQCSVSLKIVHQSAETLAVLHAGADVLFVGKGADVGVTVSPIRINSLKEFGSLETVGERLLGTERAKARPCPELAAQGASFTMLLQLWRAVLQ